MAVAIRLKRGGRTHEPYYRVVVVDSRARRDGRVLEELGVYQPCARPEPKVQVDTRRALAWLYQGAQPTDTVRKVLASNGVMDAYGKGVKPEELAVPEVEAAAVEVKAERKRGMSPAASVIAAQGQADHDAAALLHAND